MQQYKILLVIYKGTIGPLIMEQLAVAFEQLGCTVHRADIASIPFQSSDPQEQQQLKKKLDALIDSVKEFKPDFALSYGESGLVRINTAQQTASNIFEYLKIPYASLFFDTPMDALPYIQNYSSSPLYTVFCWDKTYVRELEQMGFAKVRYLPLATNPQVFAPSRTQPKTTTAFVGSYNSQDWKKQLSGSPLLYKLTQLAVKLVNSSQDITDIRAALEKAALQLPEDSLATFEKFRPTKQYRAFEAFLTSTLNAIYRSRMVLAYKKPLELYGNPAWLYAGLDPNVTFKGPTRYGPPLATVYNSSLINLNLTSFQMVEAVNQRVFDVACCSRLCLSDYKKDIENLFEPDKEVVYFRTQKEMNDLAAHYLKNPSKALQIAHNARKRVLSEHLWIHRAQTIAKEMA